METAVKDVQAIGGLPPFETKVRHSVVFHEPKMRN